MFEINQDSYNQGRAAYDVGKSLLFVMARMKEIHDEPPPDSSPDSHDDWRTREAKSNSFQMGFADGALADLRKVAGGSRGGGQRA